MEYKCPRCGYKTPSEKRIDNHFNRKNLCKNVLENITYEECKKRKNGEQNPTPKIKKVRGEAIKKVKKKKIVKKEKVPLEPEIDDIVDKVKNILQISPPEPKEEEIEKLTQKVKKLKVSKEQKVSKEKQVDPFPGVFCDKCKKKKWNNYFSYNFAPDTCRTCWNKENQKEGECIYDTINRQGEHLIKGVNVYYTLFNHAIRYDDWAKINGYPSLEEQLLAVKAN